MRRAPKQIVAAIAGIVAWLVPLALVALPVRPMAGDVHYRDGFSPSWTTAAPADDPAWRLVPADLRHCTAVRLTGGGVARYPSRTAFTPWKFPPVEFTLRSSFELPAGATGGGRILGLYISQIAENWEVFVNGALVRSEMHRGPDGAIAQHRDLRFVRFPLHPGALREGRNELAVRIVGDPTFIDTGVFRRSQMVVDDYQAILKRHAETVYLSLITLYLFVGIYHLFLFLMRREERFNLFFGLFTCMLFVYLYSRTFSAQELIPDTNILRRIEFVSLFTLFPLVGAFLDLVLRGRVCRFTVGNAIASGVLVCGVVPFSLAFAVDVLRVWQFTAPVPLAVILYRMVRSLVDMVREQRDRDGARGGTGAAFLRSLVRTVPGNLFLGGMIMIAFTGFDIVDAVFFNRNVILVRYGFFVFVIGITIVLANRFRQVHERVEELNRDLGQKLDELGEASRAISLSEEKYKHLVEDTRDVIFTLDTALQVETINRAVYDHLRIEPSQLIGAPFISLIYAGTEDTALSRQIAQEKLAELFHANEPVRFAAALNSAIGQEPKEMMLRFKMITIGGKNQILGKATGIEEDFLLRHFVAERQRYEIGNYITSADELSMRLTRNCVRFLDARNVKYLRIALREMILNAIEHGNLCITFNEKTEAIANDCYLQFIAQRRADPRYRDRTVVVEYSLNGRRVAYRITDQGPGFDHAGFMARMREVNENLMVHGRGIMMAKNIFTRVRFNQAGNRVYLVKTFQE